MMTTDDGTWQVVDSRRRVHLESAEESDARNYLVANFPHVHIEPGMGRDVTPDVVLVDPDGVRHAYVGGKWVEDVDYQTENGRFVTADTTPARPAKKTVPPVKKD